jgi:hypothetical protein
MIDCADYVVVAKKRTDHGNVRRKYLQPVDTIKICPFNDINHSSLIIVNKKFNHDVVMF